MALLKKYLSSRSSWLEKLVTNNLEQKLVDKFTKLIKIGLSRDCLTANFCDFLPRSVKYWLLINAIKSKHFSDFLEFPNFLRFEVLSRLATREATRTFIFWWYQSSSVLLVVKRGCAKTWKTLQKFCPRLSENIPFSLYLFKNALKL